MAIFGKCGDNARLAGDVIGHDQLKNVKDGVPLPSTETPTQGIPTNGHSRLVFVAN